MPDGGQIMTKMQDVGMDLAKLSDSERGAILAVLERDELLRRQEKQHLHRLKTELSWLRRRGAVRVDEDDGTGGTGRSCGRCRAELGLLLNRGAACRACRQRVCKHCRQYSVNGRDWVCTVCHKHIEIQLASGEWMNEFVRRPSRRRENKTYVPPADVVKRSLIKRSWTISSPGSVERNSPELRVYGSQPTPSPRKPLRGHHAHTDENEPPWDAPLYPPPRGAQHRRYSMSSFDGVPPGPRHLKGPAPLPPRGHYHDNGGSPRPHSPANSHHQSCPDSPPVAQRRRLLPELPQQTGGHGPPIKPSRSSTLPRRLKEPREENPGSSGVQQDSNWFHSMPRTRSRSPSGAGRGRSEPARRAQSPVVPLRENPALGGYISSGPVTSTPILHDVALAQKRRSTRDGTPTPAPREMSRPPANGRPPDQGVPLTNAARRLPPYATPSVGRSSRGDHEQGSVCRIIKTEVEGGGSAGPGGRSEDQNRSLLLTNNCRSPASRVDSGVSGLSRGGTSDTSDHDTDVGVFRRISNAPRSHQPANTPPTLNSGFATTGRPRKPSQNPAGVRRSRSFQVGSRRPDDEIPLPLAKESLSGQVARYVQELERGIQMTVENMKPRKPPLLPGDSPKPPSSPSKDSSHSGHSRSTGRRHRDKQTSSPSDTSDTGTSKLEFDDRSSCPQSDHSSSANRHSDTASDIVLDAEKILPEGDDYKLVFISSDSSKESELNSSIDSDNSGSPSRRVSSMSAVNDSDNAGFIDESDWDYFESESQAGRRRKGGAPRVSAPARVDACVMTESEYLSGSGSEGEESESDVSLVPDSSMDLSLRVPSPLTTPSHQKDDSGVSKATSESQGVQTSFDSPSTSDMSLLAPLTTLDSAELRAMLRQTEAVQAEAQALQAALMGAFPPPDNFLNAIPGGRWFRRGDSTRSSAERSMGELSCHDQVRSGLGTPHDSPALREYRKRVLTEIQNYYGVNQSHVTSRARPDWHSYRQHHHQQRRSASPAAPRLPSPVSYQRSDKAGKQSVARDQGSSNCNNSVKAATTTAPSAVRKSSKDISIQTDPDPGVLANSCWDEEDLNTVSLLPATLLPAVQDIPRVQDTSTSTTVSRTGERVRPQGYTAACGKSGGSGDCGGGGEMFTPHLPQPPSFHLHLTLSREPSVAHPSDSETEERVFETSSCVSSERGGESTSDFEYQENLSAPLGSVEGGVKEENTEGDDGVSADRKEGKREHGGHSEGETSRSPRIAPATTNTTHAHPHHNIRPSPPQPPPTRPSPPRPAPRKTMSTSRLQQLSLREDSVQEGDLDASQRGIPPLETPRPESPRVPPPSEPAVVLEAATSSSSTSEAEDTDEDVHVSRSYDVSGADNSGGETDEENIKGEEAITSLLEDEPPDGSSSSSSSDTDEDKHVSKEYDLTRSSSTDSGLEKPGFEIEEREEGTSALVEALNEKVFVGGAEESVHHHHHHSDITSIQDVITITTRNVVDVTSVGDDVTAHSTQPMDDVITNIDNNKISDVHDDVAKSTMDISTEGDISGADLDNSGADTTVDKSCSTSIDNPSQDKKPTSLDDVTEHMDTLILKEGSHDKEETIIATTKEEIADMSEEKTEEMEVENPGQEETKENQLDKVPEIVRDIDNDSENKGDFYSAGDSVSVMVEKVPVTEGESVVEKCTTKDDSTSDQFDDDSCKENKNKILNETDQSAVKDEKIESDKMKDDNGDNVGDSEEKKEECAKKGDSVKSEDENNDAHNTEVTLASNREESSNKEDIDNDGNVLDNTVTIVDALTSEDLSRTQEVPGPQEKEESVMPVKVVSEGTTPGELSVTPEGVLESRSETSELGNVCDVNDSVTPVVSEAALGEECDVPPSLVDSQEGHSDEGAATLPRESEGLQYECESDVGTAALSPTGENPRPGTDDAGSTQVEHTTPVTAATRHHPSVTLDAPAGLHVSASAPQPAVVVEDTHSFVNEVLLTTPPDNVVESEAIVHESSVREAESSESGRSSGGESEVEGEDPNNIVKITVREGENTPLDEDGVRVPVGGRDANRKHEVTRFVVRRVRSPDFLTSRHTPPVPSRRTKRSSFSDGVSSSSDIERSDADASDSADTVVEGGKLHAELRRFALQQRLHDHDDKSRDSDGPSSADSVLHGADSESQCSDNSEEGNLVSIVSVGDEDEHTTRLSSHGKIYIRSDSTDSDVQIKPTCIVVTGSSGAESGDDGDPDSDIRKTKRNIKNEGNDVTILEVTSDCRRDHVMSVHVTSPDSSRSTSPARRSQVSELQSMILTTRERQQQFRRSPTEMKESGSSLANYFTLTLGTDSPHAPRRLNKTPEIRRRKVERPETVESPSTTSPTSPAQTPDHSEGDLLAYEENHGIDIEEEEYTIPNDYDSEDTERAVAYPDEGETYDEDISFDEVHHEFPEADEFDSEHLCIEHEVEGPFESLEDGESIHSESNYSESSGDEICEREDELRGYCNRAIDFTLHTIIEESCEESDYERRTKDEESSIPDPSELEKYFYFGLGNGPPEPKRYANEESEYSDTFSETSSSIFSEGVDIDPKYDEDVDPAELASSRLEKYFLTGFLGFERQPSIRSVGEDSELHTDESGSVGSDSEGSPSPEQPRKKLVRRNRGFRTGVVNRNLAAGDRGDGAPSDGSHHSEGDEIDRTLVSGEDEGSTESEETAFDKADGQFDTIKRRKKKKSSSDYSDKRSDSDKSELRCVEQHDLEHREELCDLKNSEVLKSLGHDCDKVTKRVTIDCDKDDKDRSDDRMEKEGDLADRKYQSRDSGFIGSSDDLLKDKPEDKEKTRLSSESSIEEGENSKKKDDCYENSANKNEEKSDSFDNDSNNNKSENEDRSSGEGKVSRSSTGSSVDLPPFSPNKARNKCCRKDSFNNWSSDEETNLMMNKMRAFFKTMISNSREAPKGQRVKPPQLVAFEAKLTNLMKTVPGINDEQVKEIVEYLSSEDTWSDSYDSSDYTSSDLEGAYGALLDQADPEMKSDLQEQISASCQQIIQKFDQSREPSDTDSAHSLFGGRACSESSEDASPSSKDTLFMYQRLMSSISRQKPDSDRGSIGSGSQGASPPLLAKVMHHIGNRLVALMHEVSGGSENGDDDSLNGCHPVTSSPKVPLFIPRKHKSVDSISVDSSIEKSSLTSTSFESEDSPTDTEQSPESDPGTPKALRRQIQEDRHGPLSIISEKSSAEDFTSLESQRTVFASHDSPRHHARLDAVRPPQATASQRSLEERGVTNIQYFVTEGSNNEVEVWQSVTIDEDKFDGREHHGVPRARRSARRQEARKAKSHMSLEKIHQEEEKKTGERSESLGDLLDRVRSSEFSSSYEQLDSDSTLKASDSLDRHIGSSSSNIRLNASSRGSLTTSSRGSLAASSRGSLNAGSRGSLQGSSGPEEEDEKKPKKLSFFRYARRSSMPDTSKDQTSPEVRSTTLPRSNPTQVASTASLPRSQSALFNRTPPSITNTAFSSLASPPSTLERLSGGSSSTGGPRSARYHAPGYRPPPPTTPKRTISNPGLLSSSSHKKELISSWSPQDESTGSVDEGMGGKSGSPSPLVGGSVGRLSGRESVASLASSTTDNSSTTHADEEIERLLQLGERKRNSLTPLGSRSESMASVCSAGAEGRYGTVVIKGDIQLALQYNYKEGQLECHVNQCRDLAAVDTKRNRSDPYVKVYLLPDKSKSGKRKTKVKKHTLNPAFEEVLRFSTTMSELDSRTLWVSVWHSDMFGRNDFLGEVIIPLGDNLFDDVTAKWYPLQDRTEPMEELSYSPRGDLIIALKFVPPDAVSSKKARRSRGALHVLIKEAKSLAAVRPHGTADPVCKGQLLPEKGKAYKQKTSVCRKTLNPVWNRTLVFEDTSLQELTERSLELTVWDHDRLGSSQFLGGCRLNLGKGKHGGRPVEWMEAAGMEVKVWEQMLERPNLWVEGSIMLRPTMDKPIYSSSLTD